MIITSRALAYHSFTPTEESRLRHALVARPTLDTRARAAACKPMRRTVVKRYGKVLGVPVDAVVNIEGQDIYIQIFLRILMSMSAGEGKGVPRRPRYLRGPCFRGDV